MAHSSCCNCDKLQGQIKRTKDVNRDLLDIAVLKSVKYTQSICEAGRDVRKLILDALANSLG